MPSAARATALRCLILAGLAGLAALLANALAAPARRLAWSGSPAVRSAPLISAPPLPAPPPPEPPAPQAQPLRARPPQGVASARPTQVTPQPRPPEPGVSSPITEIDSPGAWRAFQSGTPFLDARRSADFAEGHIPRAWCVPLWEADLEDRLLAFKAARRPGPEDAIVIYCSGGDCRDSHLLAARLLQQGYYHLLIYRDGFPGWVAQQHPVEKGQP